MRITFILSSLKLSGGVRDIIEIVNRLAADNHSICLVLPRGTVDSDTERELAPCVEIKTSKIAGTGKLTLLHLVGLAFDLACRVPKSDILVSTQTPTTISTLIASFLFQKGKPVWFYQDYLEMFLDRPIISWILKRALFWHKSAIVLSQYSKEELSRYVKGKRIIVCSVGLSHSEFFHPYNKIDRVGGKDNTKYILTLGDMRPRKGWNDFWTAIDRVIEKIKTVEVWFVSKEDCVFSTTASFKYYFRPSRKVLAYLYSTADVFVSASWWESFGIPPLEAMACGTPVVMTDSRGGREYSRDYENCLLVPPMNPGRLAEAIVTVLEDHELAKKFRYQGPLTAATFTWEASYKKFIGELNRVYSNLD